MPSKPVATQTEIPSYPLSDWGTKWKSISIIENGDPLVDIASGYHQIKFDPFYLRHNIKGAISSCYVRKSVLINLQKAASGLPHGFSFLVFDAWRPLQVQTSLFFDYKDALIESTPNLDDDTYTQMTQQFVSLPSNSPTAPSPHYTGGSIDLTIVDDSGTSLDMGTAFDDFTDAAHTDHFEHSPSKIRENRRLLYHLMTAAGFSNYPFEWWHFDYGNQFWAYRLQHTHALYGPIDINPNG